MSEGGAKHRLAKVGGYVLGVVAFVAAYAATNSGIRQFIELKFESKAAIERKLDAEMANSSEFSTMYVELKKNFPTDYSLFLSHMADVAKSGANSAAVRREAFQWAHDFMQSHLKFAAHAPTPNLVEFLKTQHKLILLLKSENVEHCASFGVSGLRPEMQFSTKELAAIGEMNAVQYRAMKAGSEHPIQRSEVSQQESQFLVTTIRQGGASESEVQMLFSGTLKSAPIAEQCSASVALYNGLAGLPDEIAAGFMSQILSASSSFPR